jgi:hypothetical protein
MKNQKRFLGTTDTRESVTYKKCTDICTMYVPQRDKIGNPAL